MLRDSAVFAVLSPETIPALDLGSKLAPMNNAHHPLLSFNNAVYLSEAVELMRHSLTQLLPLKNILKHCDIELGSYSLSLNLIHSYIYIIDATLELEKNKQAANYAHNKKMGAK